MDVSSNCHACHSKHQTIFTTFKHHANDSLPPHHVLSFFPPLSFSQQAPCKIDALLLAPLSGPAASIGTDCVNVAQLALESLSPDIRDRISLRVDDTQMKPAVAVNAFKSQISRGKPDVTLVAFSESTNAVSPIAAREGVVMIGIGPSRKFLDGNELAFRHWVDPEGMSPVLVKELKAKGYARVGVIYSEHPAQAEFARYFVPFARKEGLEVVVEASILPDELELRSVVSQVLSKKPDTIVYFVLPPQPSVLTKAIRSVNKKIPLHAFIYTESLTEIQNAAGAMEGVVYAAPAFSEDFQERYARKYQGDYAEGISGSFYDSILLLGHAAAANACTGVELQRFLSGVKSFTGIAGTYGVNETREFPIPVQLKTIQNGKIVSLQR